MTIYLINYILLPFWGLIKNNRFVVLISGFQLFLIMALRSECLGVDVDVYSNAFHRFSSLPLNDVLKALNPFGRAFVSAGFESGFFVMNWIVGSSGFSFHSFLVICAAICILSLSVFIYRYSRIPWLSFAIIISIGMYGYMFCILRQSLATAILYFSIPLIRQRQFLKFFLLVFLAAQFHFVAWIFLPLYWLSRISINPVNFFRFIFLSFILGLSIPLLNKYVISAIFRSLNKVYILDNLFVYNNMFFLVFIIVLFIFIFYIYNNIELNQNDCTLFWGCAMAIPIQTLAFSITIFSRASIGIFLPFSAILITNLVVSQKNSFQINFWAILFYVCFFLYYLFFGMGSGLNIVPYRFYYE